MAIERPLTATTARPSHDRHALLVASRAHLDKRGRTVRAEGSLLIVQAVDGRGRRGAAIRFGGYAVRVRLYLHGHCREHVVVGGEFAEWSARVRIPRRICVQAKEF